MELKRYVLVRNTEVYGKSIVDTVIDTHLHVYENDVIKTSDNILDLVEVGDLVELDGKSKRNDVHMIVSVIDGDMITYDDLFIYKNKNYDDVTAIYKKQPNGDYKRYEVER